MHPLLELFTEATIASPSRFFQLTTSIFFIQVNYLLQRSVKANIISRITFLRTYTISRNVLLKIDKTGSKLIVDLKNNSAGLQFELGKSFAALALAVHHNTNAL